MPLRRSIAPALLLATLACGGGPTAPGETEGLRAVVTTPSLALGADIPVVLRNQASAEVTVGPLGCSASLERRNPADGSWTRLASLRSCIAIVHQVPNGDSFAFDVPSPDATGRYRVAFSAQVAGRGTVEVRSNSFEVK